MEKRVRIKLAFLLFLFVVAFVSIYVNWREDRRGLLTVAFLNIGQGDSIYIEAPSGNQLLIDGGSGRQVLRELGSVMPFWDRSINVVIATHPDADHIGGLNDVLDNYKVDTFMEPGIDDTTQTYKALEARVEEKQSKGQINKIEARRGMVVDLGSGAELQILFPDRDPRGFPDTNTASIVARLVYGKETFLLTGDSPQDVEKYLISLDPSGATLKSVVLKPGHHGSRTSSSPEYIEKVAPEYAVISAGLNNKYGHPHKETLDTLNKYGVKIFRTDLQGRIIFKTNGDTLSENVSPWQNN